MIPERAVTSKATNEVTSKANNDPNSTEAWEMALAVVAALEQTRDKALEEHRVAVEAAGGNPFGKGIMGAQHLIEAINEALSTIKPDLRAIGRANGRALPKEMY